MKASKHICWILVLMLTIAGCGPADPATADLQEAASIPEQVRIAIIQTAENPNLDAAREGFLQAMKENGFREGQNLTVVFRNACNDETSLQTIAQDFASQPYDLIFAIATPAAIAVAKEIQKTPILFTAVTDPLAVKLVKDIAQPGTNATGTSDLNPVKEQFNLIKKFLPQAKNIGVLYNKAELNSRLQVSIAQEAAQTLGLNLCEATAAERSEILPALESLMSQVDAVYIPTGDTILSEAQAVSGAATRNKIPLFCGQKSFVNAGGLAAITVNYEHLGRQTARMAIEVLSGSKPQELPVEYPKEYDVTVNKAAARHLGVSVADSL